MGWELKFSETSSWILHTPLPLCLLQDSVKGQLLVVLEHGSCGAGSCLHALSVFLGNTHIQLRSSGSISSASLSSAGGLYSLQSKQLHSLLLWWNQLSLWSTVPQAQATQSLSSTLPLWIPISSPSRFLHLNLLQYIASCSQPRGTHTISRIFSLRPLLLIFGANYKPHSCKSWNGLGHEQKANPSQATIPPALRSSGLLLTLFTRLLPHTDCTNKGIYRNA